MGQLDMRKISRQVNNKIEGEDLLDQPGKQLWRNAWSGRQGERAEDIVYLGFSNVFDTVSCRILIDKLFVYGVDNQKVKWDEKLLMAGLGGFLSV